MAEDNFVSNVLARVSGRKKAESQDQLMRTKAERFYQSAEDHRKQLDWKWFMYDLWVSGNHYAKWDKNTQQIVTTVRDDGRPKVVINKVYTTLRAIRNYTLRNKPKAEVTPDDLTEENVDQAAKLNRYLDFLHDKLHLRRKLKESLWHALKYSVGFWQVLWNEEADDGQGEIEVAVIDPYDLYWDPVARHPNEARFVILAIRRNIEDLKDDPKYEKYKAVLDGVSGDKMIAASNLKARLLQAERGSELTSHKEDGTVIVKECWIKEKQKDGSFRVRIVTLAGDQLIRNELTELGRFPFFRLAADIEPLSLYGQGWVKNLIPVNRLLDRLESQLAEYNDLMNRGKWIADKGAGVRVINNENGQIIEKKKGFEVTQATISPLSAAIYTQIENTNRYIEDIGGAHDASLGRIPPGAKSGRALEALQVGDSNNMSEVIENTEEFLEEVYEYILSLAAEKYQFARRIIPLTQSGEREFVKVIGESAANKPEDAVVISSKNVVDVKITSWLAHTAEARREVLKELYQLQAIDQQTLLEGYEIGAVANIIQRTQAELEQRQAQELAAQGVAREQANAVPQAGTKQAIAAIRSIIQGQPVTMPEGVSQEFVDYIDDFLASEQLPPELAQAIQTFRDQVVQQGGQNAA